MVQYSSTYKQMFLSYFFNYLLRSFRISRLLKPNMKSACLVALVLLAGVILCKDKNTDYDTLTDTLNDFEDERELIELIAATIKETCDDNGLSFPKRKFKKAYAYAKFCLTEYMPPEFYHLTLNDVFYNDTVAVLCSFAVGIDIRDCLEDVVAVIEDCSRPDQKYFPGFVTSVTNNLKNYLCRKNGTIIRQLASRSVEACKDTISFNKDSKEICGEMPKIYSITPEATSKLKKTVLCRELHNLETCYVDVVTKKCPRKSNYRKIISEMFDIVTSPCDV